MIDRQLMSDIRSIADFMELQSNNVIKKVVVGDLLIMDHGVL